MCINFFFGKKFSMCSNNESCAFRIKKKSPFHRLLNPVLLTQHMWSRRSAIELCRSSAIAKIYSGLNVRFCCIDDRSMIYKAKLSSSGGMTSLECRSTTPHGMKIVRDLRISFANFGSKLDLLNFKAGQSNKLFWYDKWFSGYSFFGPSG